VGGVRADDAHVGDSIPYGPLDRTPSERIDTPDEIVAYSQRWLARVGVSPPPNDRVRELYGRRFHRDAHFSRAGLRKWISAVQLQLFDAAEAFHDVARPGFAGRRHGFSFVWGHPERKTQDSTKVRQNPPNPSTL
jgi:hypothetical protein